MTTVSKETMDRLGGDWESRLHLTPTKTPKANLVNAMIALRGAPAWAGVIAHDEFALCTMVMRPPPWVKTNANWDPRAWTEPDDIFATEWMQEHGIGVQVSTVRQAIEAVAQERALHPIRDYLGGLKWDGKERVEGFAATYLGAEKSKYHSTVSRCLLVSAVARVMEPGCKADHATILEGPQGRGKSTAIGILAAPWFTDDIADLGTKDSAMQVRSSWIIELAELSAMQRNELEKTKAFVSRQTDKFRPPYGHRLVEVKRQSIFMGSTNAEHYLKDETGARRFWPLRCGHISLAKLARDKDQLWAEAVQLYKDGARWWLEDGDEVLLAQAEQDERRVVDAWEEPISKYIVSREDVTVGEVLETAFAIEKAKWTQLDQNRVARCLIGLGWRRGWRGKERCYRRPEA
jgi:predicted P-loop ATPase